MIFGSVVSILIFAVLVLMATLQMLAASGHFPLHVRDPGMKSAPAVLLLCLSLMVTATALIAGALAAWESVPWQALVIAAGLSVLAAPVVLQQFSDRFVDGRAALVTFAAGAAFSALLLVVVVVAY